MIDVFVFVSGQDVAVDDAPVIAIGLPVEVEKRIQYQPPFLAGFSGGFQDVARRVSVLEIFQVEFLQVARRVSDVWKVAMEQGYDKAILVCDFRIRPHLAAMISRQVPQLPVLAYDEIAEGTNIESIGSISIPSEPVEAQLATA